MNLQTACAVVAMFFPCVSHATTSVLFTEVHFAQAASVPQFIDPVAPSVSWTSTSDTWEIPIGDFSVGQTYSALSDPHWPAIRAWLTDAFTGYNTVKITGFTSSSYGFNDPALFVMDEYITPHIPAGTTGDFYGLTLTDMTVTINAFSITHPGGTSTASSIDATWRIYGVPESSSLACAIAAILAISPTTRRRR